MLPLPQPQPPLVGKQDCSDNWRGNLWGGRSAKQLVALFQVVFICYRVLSQTYIFQFHFFCNCHFCLSQTCIFHSHFFCNCHFYLFQTCIFLFFFLHLSFLPFSTLHFSFAFFFAFVIFAFLWVAFFNPIFFALFLHFFQVENILEQAQFDSTTLRFYSLVL